MSNLATKLDEVTKHFWHLWRDWRFSQGWRLGPDDAGAKLSPFMVRNWDQLSDEGRLWFKQHTALVLGAIEQAGTTPVVAEVATTNEEPTERQRVAQAVELTTAGSFREAAAVLESVPNSSAVVTKLKRAANGRVSQAEALAELEVFAAQLA
jgi:hypothetical protein